MKKALKISLFIIASFCFVVSAQAQKFGYVNSAKILSELASVKQAESNLEALQTQLQKKYQQTLQTFQTKVQELQKQADEGKLSPVQQQEQGAKLQQEEQDIVKMQNDMVTQLDTKRQELLKPIYDSINTAIKEVAEAEGYQFIFEQGVLLYADESNDITEKVKAKVK